MKKSITLHNSLKQPSAFIAAIALFSVIPAIYAWNFTLKAIIIGLCAILFIFDINSYGYNKKNVFLFIYFAIILTIFSLGQGSSFFGWLELFCALPLIIIRKQFSVQIYQYFTKIFAFCMAISLVIYFLVVWFGIDLPHQIIPPLNINKSQTYYLFPFLVTTDNYGITPYTMRFCGLFDEPGVVGTICTIILIVERYNMKKIENWIVLIAGISSFSLFFILISAIYVLVEAPVKYKLLVLLLAIILTGFIKSDETLYYLIGRRLEFDDGKLSGMNRDQGGFDDFFKNFRHTSYYWWGLGAGYGAKLNEGGSSYKMIIVDMGVVFFVAYLLCFYILCFKNFNKYKMYILFSLSFLGTMYQRPFVGDATYTFLTIVSIYIISNNYKNKADLSVVSSNILPG